MVADLGSRVLIADRDASLRQLLYSRLLEIDLFSDCVANGRDALEKLGDTGYAVLIIDVTLTDVDAIQVIERIAQMPAAQRPVVLVLAERPEAARTMDVDIVQIILRKPVDVTQLAELVGSCVRSAARRAALAPVPPKKSGDQLTS
ncbi:MAG: Response regulator receiver domain [Acidobacteriota bacterium]|jgi:DNA-binding response OmpR family regulator|nr:Response regulator receiver domain [Acidobacteriota bacterium]